MAANTTWRWMFWSTSAFQAVMVLVSFPAFHETYAPLILKRRAAKLRHITGDQQYSTAAERFNAGRSVGKAFRRSMSRPVRLLATHPIIQVIACAQGFYYGILYIVLSTLSQLWVRRYHESVEISGLHYIAAAAGEVLGSQIGGPLMDNIFSKLKQRANGDVAPEYHMPLVLPGALLTIVGLFVYGWTVHFGVFWFMVDVSVVLMTFGMQIAGMSLQAYVIDAYPEHTSSATAAGQFIRSLTAFAFPLFAPKLYSTLGYGWGNSTLALLSLVIVVPAPLLVWRYGLRLRAKAQSSY